MTAYILWSFLGGRRTICAENFFKCEFGVLRPESSVEDTSFTVGKNWKSIWATQYFLYICSVTLDPGWSHRSLRCHGNSIRLVWLCSQIGQWVPWGQNHVILILSSVNCQNAYLTLSLYDLLSTSPMRREQSRHLINPVTIQANYFPFYIVAKWGEKVL